ncbi:glycosyltransferase family 2 protein [Pedobacter aquatilis]|uniref:glycosyltransferase family 2 protein n=1 Tax=Pedobacter aquatilis TaxID=351343 RepID=UPI0029302AEA|nr:glycosyltransferase family 2 protein [Pedobacter aquatilis]
MTKSPLVSVCIPAYNAESYIRDSIDCLLRQSYDNIEIIIVNDGSTDGTLKEVRKFNSYKINVISVPNKGAASARNIAYQYSKGMFVIFFDADDLLSEDFIKNQLIVLDGDEECVAISSWGRFYKSIEKDFKLDNDLTSQPDTLQSWIIRNWTNNHHNTPPGRLLISRKILDKMDGWDESLSLNDDFEFFTRVAFNCKAIKPNYGSIYYYRSGINGLSSKKNEKAYKSLFFSMKRSFDLCLKAFPTNELVKQACANLWQSFIYESYPLLKLERDYSETEIARLGGSKLKIAAGGLTKYLNIIFGWKRVKLFKKILTYKSFRP